MNVHDLSFSASQVAKVIDAGSVNVVSVWANRGLITPSNVINLSSKKRVFEFSYVNLFQAALLKELGDHFLVQYEFLNRLKSGESGFGGEELERALKEERGFLVVTDRTKSETAGGGSRPERVLHNIEWELIDGHEGVAERISRSRYALVMNIREISRRLMKRIKKLNIEE